MITSALKAGMLPDNKRVNNMKISKSIINYANRRNLDLSIHTDSVYGDLLCFWELDQESEWLFSYRMNEDGSLSWNGNIYLDKEIKEELPGTIFDEKQLKTVINFVSQSLK